MERICRIQHKSITTCSALPMEASRVISTRSSLTIKAVSAKAKENKQLRYWNSTFFHPCHDSIERAADEDQARYFRVVESFAVITFTRKQLDPRFYYLDCWHLRGRNTVYSLAAQVRQARHRLAGFFQTSSTGFERHI